MKKTILSLVAIGIVFVMNAQINIQNAARYMSGNYDGTYIHGVDNLGNPAASGDPSFRELPSGVTGGVYSWWNYLNSVGEPSNSYGAAIGFGNGVAGSAEIWAGWTNGKLYSRFLRDCCQGWSAWNEIWTANTDGSGSGLDADTVDGLQPILIQSSGNVGIGTTSPDAKLTVKGNIHTNEVKVDLLGSVAPDYVFKTDYRLKSIKEVEDYIATEGHLPNIPSAEQMEANGIQLKEMNLKLLEKIEELTLYTIDQEKRIETLEAKNEKLIALAEKILNKKIEE